MAHDESENSSHDTLSRRGFLGVGLAAGGALALGDLRLGRSPLPGAPAAAALGTTGATSAAPFALEEATIADLQKGMAAGTYTSRSIAEQYLARIDELDKRGPALNQIIELNPDALSIADAMDAERKAGKVRGPLHGVPVLIKDNIATADKMQTTAGSLALVGSKVPRDAFVAQRLREAGAVILGKTNLSEWANFRSTHSSSGWSGRGGLSHNPYALDRTASGSSSGSGGAIAANFAAVAVGTETDGSVTSPAAASSLVGIKPTVGLVSRAGIVPISHTQDTAGPMTRTVADAAALLSAIAGHDPRDSATNRWAMGVRPTDYTKFLDPNGLRGARIGVAREHYTGYNTHADKALEAALAVMKAQGAVIVDPANIATAKTLDADEFDLLMWEFKTDLNAYLAGLTESPVRTLADVIAFNEKNADREMPYFGQEIMTMSQKKGALTEAKYKAILAKGKRLAGAQGIDATITKHRLDAIVAPTQGPPVLTDLVNGDPGGGGSFTSPAAVAGYPHVTVPAGYAFGLPLGISFVGPAWSEGTLIKLAYAYEQATKHRRPPRFLRTAELGVAAD
ncbi:MAG TPA: amidase [Gemmatimonadaceae bacterium]|nr:amidase [Gemmatimonadaceae bacterium]